MTLRELLEKVDEREEEREKLNRKCLVLMKRHIEHQLKELKEREYTMSKARERKKRKERVRMRLL